MGFGTNGVDHRIKSYQDIVMNQKLIADLHGPNGAQDAVS
jgi:hypothetical protein